MTKRPTMSDVARVAGVHKATASRALNPLTSGQVNPATARRVLAAARQMGYTPNATARSLIILDEIGRGTSTFDGLSLAWSIVEHLHNQVGAKTLFATHYHELTELAGRLPRVRNYNVAVREWHDQIVFLRKIVEGGTDKSYGIQVARLAGVPKAVLERAREILRNLEES